MRHNFRSNDRARRRKAFETFYAVGGELPGKACNVRARRRKAFETYDPDTATTAPTSVMTVLNADRHLERSCLAVRTPQVKL